MSVMSQTQASLMGNPKGYPNPPSDRLGEDCVSKQSSRAARFGTTPLRIRQTILAGLIATSVVAWTWLQPTVVTDAILKLTVETGTSWSEPGFVAYDTPPPAPLNVTSQVVRSGPNMLSMTTQSVTPEITDANASTVRTLRTRAFSIVDRPPTTLLGSPVVDHEAFCNSTTQSRTDIGPDARAWDSLSGSVAVAIESSEHRRSQRATFWSTATGPHSYPLYTTAARTFRRINSAKPTHPPAKCFTVNPPTRNSTRNPTVLSRNLSCDQTATSTRYLTEKCDIERYGLRYAAMTRSQQSSKWREKPRKNGSSPASFQCPLAVNGSDLIAVTVVEFSDDSLFPSASTRIESRTQSRIGSSILSASLGADPAHTPTLSPTILIENDKHNHRGNEHRNICLAALLTNTCMVVMVILCYIKPHIKRCRNQNHCFRGIHHPAYEVLQQSLEHPEWLNRDPERPVVRWALPELLPLPYPEWLEPDVLISYTTALDVNDSTDTQGEALMLRVTDVLAQNGLSFYHGKMCPSGSSWKEQWFGRVRSARAAVVMLSPAYFNSESCVQELLELLRSDLAYKIVPVIVADPEGTKAAMKLETLVAFFKNSRLFKNSINETLITANFLKTMLGTANWLPPPQGVLCDDFDKHCAELVWQINKFVREPRTTCV